MNKNITALILIVVAAGLYFTVTRGMIADAKAVKVQNDSIVQAIDNSDQLKAKREAVMKEYNAISAEDRANVDKMIPSSVDTIRLIIDLNNRALAHGFSLSGVKATVPTSQQGGAQPMGGQQMPAPTIPGAPIGSLPTIAVGQPTLDKVNVSFSASAPYDQFQAFMRDLEKNLRIMDVTHVSVSTGANDLYTFDVQLVTYWLRQ